MAHRREKTTPVWLLPATVAGMTGMALGIACLAPAPPALAKPPLGDVVYLEIPFTCESLGRSIRLTRSDTPQRYRILRWGGELRVQGRRVYRYIAECQGQPFIGLHFYLAAPRSEQARVRDGRLQILTGFRSERVVVRPRACRWVSRVIEVDPPNNPCYYDIMHPDCDPSRRYYRTVRERRCTPAQYGTRQRPVFITLPKGFAPLPPGAKLYYRR